MALKLLPLWFAVGFTGLLLIAFIISLLIDKLNLVTYGKRVLKI